MPLSHLFHLFKGHVFPPFHRFDLLSLRIFSTALSLTSYLYEL
jgi:hypothetical protein